jgi:hypothetical protein
VDNDVDDVGTCDGVALAEVAGLELAVGALLERREDNETVSAAELGFDTGGMVYIP